MPRTSWGRGLGGVRGRGFSTQAKSAKYGPIGCWRRNFSPASRFARRTVQIRDSGFVWRVRSSRLRLVRDELAGRRAMPILPSPWPPPPNHSRRNLSKWIVNGANDLGEGGLKCSARDLLWSRAPMLVADAEAARSMSVAFSGSPLPQEVRAINFPWELIMPRTSWGRGCVSLRVFP